MRGRLPAVLAAASALATVAVAAPAPASAHLPASCQNGWYHPSSGECHPGHDHSNGNYGSAAAVASAQPAPVVHQQVVGASTPAPVSSASSGGYVVPSSVVQAESGGNPYARNPSSGAYGLYQIIPSTARANGCNLGSIAGQHECARRIMASQGPSAWSATWGR